MATPSTESIWPNEVAAGQRLGQDKQGDRGGDRDEEPQRQAANEGVPEVPGVPVQVHPRQPGDQRKRHRCRAKVVGQGSRSSRRSGKRRSRRAGGSRLSAMPAAARHPVPLALAPGPPAARLPGPRSRASRDAAGVLPRPASHPTTGWPHAGRQRRSSRVPAAAIRRAASCRGPSPCRRAQPSLRGRQSCPGFPPPASPAASAKRRREFITAVAVPITP